MQYTRTYTSFCPPPSAVTKESSQPKKQSVSSNSASNRYGIICTGQYHTVDAALKSDTSEKNPNQEKSQANSTSQNRPPSPDPLWDILNIIASDEESKKEEPWKSADARRRNRGNKSQKTGTNAKQEPKVVDKIPELNKLRDLIENLQNIAKINISTKVEKKKGIEQAYLEFERAEMNLAGKGEESQCT